MRNEGPGGSTANPAMDPAHDLPPKQMLKVGLLAGREISFPAAFVAEVAKRDAGVEVELVRLGGTSMDEPIPYAVIIDRMSHEAPYYRTYLKHAALQGCVVVNNPFMWSADDKLFEASLASSLGVASPKTLALPNHSYRRGLQHPESLRNLTYPLDWNAIVEYVGMPCVLKDAHGGGWRHVYFCRSLDELIRHYDATGTLTMIVQEFIEWDRFVRCLSLGQRDVRPMNYDPIGRRYPAEHQHLAPALAQRIVDDSLTLVRALGYDMCSLEFAVRGGVPYAIDFMNPVPDLDASALTPPDFDWAVRGMADLAIRLARAPLSRRELRSGAFLLGRREGDA